MKSFIQQHLGEKSNEIFNKYAVENVNVEEPLPMSVVGVLITHHKELIHVIYKVIESLDKGNFDATSTISVSIVSVYCCVSLDLMLEVIQDLINSEIDKKESASTLFRSNSPATHIMTTFVKEVGGSYLSKTLSPTILKMMENCYSGNDYEIDPAKILPSENTLFQNIDNLKQLVNSFVDSIINSIDNVPTAFRKICLMFRESTKINFPDSKYTIIGGFFFLRYICPAIITPDKIFLINNENPILQPSMRRALVLACKVIQTAVNNTVMKEPYMVPLKYMVQDIVPRLETFLNALTDISSVDVPVHFHEPPENFTNGIVNIREFIGKNLGKILEIIISNSSPPNWLFIRDLSLLNDLPLFTPEQRDNNVLTSDKITDFRISLISSVLVNPVDTPNISQTERSSNRRHSASGNRRLSTGSPMKIAKHLPDSNEHMTESAVEFKIDQTPKEGLTKRIKRLSRRLPKNHLFDSKEKEEVEDEEKLSEIKPKRPATTLGIKESKKIKSRSVGHKHELKLVARSTLQSNNNLKKHK